MHQLSALLPKTHTIIVLVLVVLVSACTGNRPHAPETETGYQRYFCGAENLKGEAPDSFYEDGMGKFSAGGIQVTDSVFAGKHACMIDSVNEYGMPIHFYDVEEGAFFEASVWIKNPVGKATLIAGFSGDADFTLHTTEVNKVRDSMGWSQYFLSFGVEAPVDTLAFFVAAAREKRYFDNFEIIRYNQRPVLPDSLSAQALKIYIPDSAMQQLSAFKAKALEQEIVSADLKEFVPGFIIRENDSMPAEIRLKGDWTDHLENGKTSYRIKVDQPYNGMTDFSIQHPQTRNFMHEWFMHRICDAEGLLSTTFDYLPVEINGVNQGIYAVEEHFDERLLEKHNRVEGPIVKLDESGFWELLASNMKDSVEGSYPYFAAAMVTAFKEGKTEKSTSLSREFQNASALLTLFKNGYMHPEELMDLEMTAKFYALMDLGNINHALAWHNRRYYYNPITAKLELIGFDMIPAVYPLNPMLAQQAFEYQVIPGAHEMAMDYFLFTNADFRNYYTFYCEKFSSETYLDSIKTALHNEIRSREKLLATEFPNYTLNLDAYYAKAEKMRTDLEGLDTLWNNFMLAVAKNPQPKLIQPRYRVLERDMLIKDISINVYLDKVDSTHYQTTVENYHLADVWLTGYSTKAGGDNIIPFTDSIPLRHYDSTGFATAVVDFSEKPDMIYFVAANTAGTVHSKRVFPWKKPQPTHPRIALSKNFNPKNPLYKITGDTLVIRKGTYSVKELIYVPERYVTLIEGGTTIDFVNKGGLIFNNSVSMNGTDAAPVIFTSSDSSAQGIAILNPEKTIIAHTKLVNLDALNYKGWGLNGALTIYGGVARINDLTIENSQADDALNIVGCDFTMEHLTVKDARKDALDADFCNGTLAWATFVNTPSDCIDSVGSSLILSDLTVNNSNLEGGSAGDYDMLRIENEIKLAVPADLADSVWAYLQNQYDNSTLYLKEKDSTFNSKMAEDIFIDQYFDNDDFHVLFTSNGVRHRARTVLTDSTNRKNGRELMQLKVNNIGSNILNRAEFKYPIKHYDEKSEMWDKHPFLGLVQRKYRQDITDRLEGYGLDATSLHPTIRLDQLRKRVYLYRGLDPFATLTLDHVTAHYGSDSAYFVEMELELNEINYTESDSATRVEMEAINDDIKADLLATFPAIHQDQTPKYNKAALAFGIWQPEQTHVAVAETPVVFAKKMMYYLALASALLVGLVVLVMQYRRK